MKKSDFYFDLPERLIAQHPLEQRDASRLMVLNRTDGSVTHRHFRDLLEYVQAADVLDGDITERVKVAEDSLDTTSPGVYPVTFEVTNSCGDRAAVTVNAVVRDADPAGSITLTDSLIYLDRGGEFQPGDYVSAVTTSSGQTLQTEGLQIYEDGYFLTNISANGTVNTAEPGCYQVEYTYRTSRSEGSAWLTVMVRE